MQFEEKLWQITDILTHYIPGLQRTGGKIWYYMTYTPVGVRTGGKSTWCESKTASRNSVMIYLRGTSLCWNKPDIRAICFRLV